MTMRRVRRTTSVPKDFVIIAESPQGVGSHLVLKRVPQIQLKVKLTARTRMVAMRRRVKTTQ